MAKAPTTTQDDPTAARPVDPTGRTLDRWGLPLGGPARVAALNGKTDPLVDATGWADAPEPAPVLLLDTPAQD